MSEEKDIEFFRSLAASPVRDPDTYGEDIEASDIEFEPVAGDKIVGKLEEAEIKRYINVLAIEYELVELAEEIQQHINSDIAKDILDNGGVVSSAITSAVIDGSLGRERAEDYFLLASVYEFKKTEFWYLLRSRLQTFATRLSIRAGFHVVTTGNKV